jgi:RNA polymerase sigma factor (sigma-70 family)
LTELELIKGCIANNHKAQKALFTRFAGKMMTVCLRYSNSRDEAEDILQEGFIKIFSKINQFNFQGSFEGWVRRIMVNTAINSVRKQFTYDEVQDYHLRDDDDVFVHEEEASHYTEQQLLDMIESLPQGYKLVFNLYAIEGCSHKEIGEMLSINESTSRSQLAKARKYLQKMLLKIKESAA